MAFVNDGVSKDDLIPVPAEAGEIQLHVTPQNTENAEGDSNVSASCGFDNPAFNKPDMYKKIPTKAPDSPTATRSQNEVLLNGGPSDKEFVEENKKKSKYNWKQFLPFAPR